MTDNIKCKFNIKWKILITLLLVIILSLQLISFEPQYKEVEKMEIIKMGFMIEEIQEQK